jgi:cytochrome P450
MCENAEELGRVQADRRLVPQLVEEAVRWTTPAQHVMRTATQDRTMHGRRIVTGDWIMLCYLSGNRDEAAFDDPDRFRIQARPNRSLAFGYGAHACLGQHLARLEMRVFFEELLDRLRGIEIAGTPRRVASVFVGGLRALPVRFSMM